MVYITGWSGKIDRLKLNVENNHPNIPDIQGPSNGKIGTSYSYTFSSEDLEGDDVFYYIEWGDGQKEEWIGPYSSDDEVTVNHTRVNQESFNIRAKAKEVYDGNSNWGSLIVSMPKNKLILHPIIQLLLELLHFRFK